MTGPQRWLHRLGGCGLLVH